MTLQTAIARRLPEIMKQYHKSNKAAKTRRLDELQALTGYFRKPLTAMLPRKTRRKPQPAGKRRRTPRTSEVSARVLYKLYALTGRLASRRLKRQLPLLLPHAARHVAGC